MPFNLTTLGNILAGDECWKDGVFNLIELVSLLGKIPGGDKLFPQFLTKAAVLKLVNDTEEYISLIMSPLLRGAHLDQVKSTFHKEHIEKLITDNPWKIHLILISISSYHGNLKTSTLATQFCKLFAKQIKNMKLTAGDTTIIFDDVKSILSDEAKDIFRKALADNIKSNDVEPDSSHMVFHDAHAAESIPPRGPGAVAGAGAGL